MRQAKNIINIKLVFESRKAGINLFNKSQNKTRGRTEHINS